MISSMFVVFSLIFVAGCNVTETEEEKNARCAEFVDNVNLVCCQNSGGYVINDSWCEGNFNNAELSSCLRQIDYPSECGVKIQHVGANGPAPSLSW